MYREHPALLPGFRLFALEEGLKLGDHAEEILVEAEFGAHVLGREGGSEDEEGREEGEEEEEDQARHLPSTSCRLLSYIHTPSFLSDKH